MIKILLADDHPVVRDGLRGMLAGEADFEVVGEAASGARRCGDRGERPDVVLMDLQMPEMDGAAATAEIAARFPGTRVLVLTTYDTDGDILRAVEAGATGYLLKDTPRERLFPAIRAAARGETVLAPTVATRLVSRMRRPASEALTSREVEVLELVARGSSNAGIAGALFISEATVRPTCCTPSTSWGWTTARRRGRGLERGIIALPRAPLRRFDQHCAVCTRLCGQCCVKRKGSRRDPVRRQRIPRRLGDGHHPPAPSAPAGPNRNAAATADLDRPGAASRASPGGVAQLAEIEEVDPGTIFQRDGAGFPDWLSANLDRLAKELGLSGLREVGRDVGVGSFTADLLAQTDRGRRVAIMSHLEPSDHLHLGQMITFAAGLDVSAVVWITTRIGEEHRAVLDWLNQHGDDDVRFFGIELRLLRIGGSQPGASFHVEARPNDWQKVIKQRQRVGSPLNSRTREF